MLTMKGNFNKSLGQGVQRVMYEMYENVKAQLEEPDSVDGIELGMGNKLSHRKVSFTLMTPLHSFKKYDIVHVLMPVATNPRVRSNAKIITQIYEFIDVPPGHILYSKQKQTPLGSMVFNKMWDQLRKSDYLMSISSLATDEAVNVMGYDRKKIFTINIGIDQRFIDIPIPKRAEKDFRVGYLGAMAKRKNVIFAVNAFKQIPDKDITFDIWGKPVLEYNNLVEAAKGDHRINFKGFAPEESLVTIYDTFDAFLYPISYTGFELEILEAQARGIPVIIDKNGLIPKEVRKYCFEAEDESHAAQIVTEIKEKGYNEKKRKEAMEYARSFTWEKTARETIAAYRKVLKE